MRLITYSAFILCLSFSFLTLVYGEIIDCTVPELSNHIDPAIRAQMNGNRKEGSLRFCALDLQTEVAVVRFHVFGRSKDQSIVRIGHTKITKTHYNVAFDLFLDFSIDYETCQPALIKDDIKFHSEGIFVSHVVRSILEVGRSEIRQKIRETIQQKIKDKEEEFDKLCQSFIETH